MNRGPYRYTVWTTAAPPLSTHPTSRTELIHVTIAFLVLTGDLFIILSGRGFLETGTLSGLIAPVALYYVLLAVAAALTGFIAHEMAHKVVARRLGYWAEFRMWPMGLLLSIITSVGGVLFAAPGRDDGGGHGPKGPAGLGGDGGRGPGL